MESVPRRGSLLTDVTRLGGLLIGLPVHAYWVHSTYIYTQVYTYIYM